MELLTVCTSPKYCCANLTKTLKFVIFVDYSKLTALAEYLEGVATILNTLNILLIRMSYPLAHFGITYIS